MKLHSITRSCESLFSLSSLFVVLWSFQPAPLLADAGQANFRKGRTYEAILYVAQANARRSDWASVARLLKAYPWEEVNDPALLTLYMEALVETHTPLPGRFLQGQVPRAFQESAVGLYALSSGQLQKAKATFTNLTADAVHAYLGWLGLALYGEAVGNPGILENSLSNIARNPHYSNSIGGPLLRELRMSLNEMQGNIAEGERLLTEDKGASKEDKLNPSVHMYYRINIALHRDRFSETRRLLDEYVSIFGEDETASLLRGSLIQLRQGPKAELQYMEKNLLERRRMPNLDARFALAMSENGKEALAIKLARQLIEQRPFDFSLKLVFADIVNVFEMDRHSLNLMRSWLPEAEDAPQLNARLALAEYFSARDRDRGLALLKVAELQFPSGREVLFARYIIARDRGELTDARRWLEKRVAAYPYEIGGQLILMDLLHETGDIEGARQAARTLQRSKRWISKSNREGIRAMAR